MSVMTASTRRRSSLTLWMARRPVTAYFVLAFAGTWLLELPMVLGQDGLGLFSYSVPFGLYVALFLLSSFSGPTLAALLVTSALEGRLGVRQFLRRYVQWRFGIGWYLFVLLAFPLVYLLAASPFLGILPLQEAARQWPVYLSTYLPALLIFPALITWGEEPGWRGFALTRLQMRYSPLVATLVVGLLHGLWHLPVFLLVNGPPALGPFSLGRFAFNILAIMVVSVIWTFVFNRARQSILMAVLLHASFNAAQAYAGTLLPQYPENAGLVAIGFFFVVAVVLVVVTRGRLGYDRDS